MLTKNCLSFTLNKNVADICNFWKETSLTLDMDSFLRSVERKAFRMAEIATGNTDESLDIVQDTMFNMVRRYSDKPEEQWKPLFYCILQNRIRDCYRQRNRHRNWYDFLTGWKNEKSEDSGNPIDSLADPSIKSPEEQALIKDTTNALDEALRTLPLRQQQVFLLRAWDEQSVADTARVMGCSQGSVKTHYSRAVHTLRKKLEGYWP
ncbi:MAG: RNA polymerase sigma factor [Vulcanimicrobiota bacterium]